MSVHVLLDQHGGPFYTNLDYLSGRVVLSLNNDTPISQINVKLEGESRTRLAGPRNPNDRPDKVKTELELHKVLYKIQTVFPESNLGVNSAAQFTLGAGRYEYPFRFKFPFNNECKVVPGPIQDLKFGSLNVQFAAPPTKHVKHTLPPTLGGFPGEAEIKYFVKATVVRPKFYQENLRALQAIKFLPIESPRPMNNAQEQYARREHRFQPYHQNPTRKSIFRKASEPSIEEPLVIKVDARLPNPPILTCHKPLPLRVLVGKTNDSSANVYLSTFQIELVAFTDVRAHDLSRTEITSWIICSKANMDMILDNPDDKEKKDYVIPTRLWESIPLPNSIIPSFSTCNITRRYELEIRVGITHGTVDGPRPELAILPLRLPCELYSGIAPPQELLTRMKTQRLSTNLSPTPAFGSQPMAHTPITPVMEDNLTAPQTGYPNRPHSVFGGDEDLPPSYEDAMAEDIAPIDGPRQHFEFSMAAESQSPSFTGDSKSSSGLNRHPSERLFTQNAPKPPRTSTGMHSMLNPGQSNSVFAEEPIDVTQNMANPASQRNTDQVRQGEEEHRPPLPPRKPTGPTVATKSEKS